MLAPPPPPPATIVAFTDVTPAGAVQEQLPAAENVRTRYVIPDAEY
jgi:hypothetical protein